MLRPLPSPASAMIAVLLMAAGVVATPRPAAAACVSCGFDVGSAIGGLAIGAIAAGAANRANQPPDGYVLDEPQQPRGKVRRPPPPVQAMGEDGAPTEPKKKSVAARPATKTTTAPAAAKSRTVATAQSGALLP